MTMRVIDAHAEVVDKVTVTEIEAFLERTGAEGAVLISRSPLGQGDGVRQCVEELAEVRAKMPDQIYVFAWLDPAYEGSAEVLEWAVRDCGAVGLKLIPSNFHPRDKCARALYALAGKLRVPILMHTGILWLPGDNADHCRPSNMEVMWDYPQTRFALAHISWPWVDECVAVVQKLNRLRPELDQVFIDLTPGTPPSYRQDAFAKCLENVGTGHLFFGSDAQLPENDTNIPEGSWRRDADILDRLGVLKEDQQKIFADNFLRFIGKR